MPRLLRDADSLAGTLTPRERAVLDTLRRWDLIARRDRVSPTIYRAWYGALQRRSRLGSLIGLTAAALDGQAPEALRDSLGHPGVRRSRRSGAAASRCARWTPGSAAIPPAWRWGRAHRATFKHRLAWLDSSLAPAPVPADGDNSTPCVGRSGLPWSTTFDHSAVFRHLVDLADTSASLGVVPPGNSGDLSSGHARDHLALWANHGYVPFYLDAERIERDEGARDRAAPALNGPSTRRPRGSRAARRPSAAGSRPRAWARRRPCSRAPPTRRTGRVEVHEALGRDLRRDLGAVAAEQRVLVGDDHASGLRSPKRAIALEVERLERAQVEDLGLDAVLGRLLRREEACAGPARRR